MYIIHIYDIHVHYLSMYILQVYFFLILSSDQVQKLSQLKRSAVKPFHHCSAFHTHTPTGNSHLPTNKPLSYPVNFTHTHTYNLHIPNFKLLFCFSELQRSCIRQTGWASDAQIWLFSVGILLQTKRIKLCYKTVIGNVIKSSLSYYKHFGFSRNSIVIQRWQHPNAYRLCASGFYSFQPFPALAPAFLLLSEGNKDLLTSLKLKAER